MRSQFRKTLVLLVAGLCLTWCSDVFAAKPDKTKGRDTGPDSAEVVLRDQEGDAISSDLGMPYVDAVDGADVSIDLEGDGFRMQSSGNGGALISLGTPMDESSTSPFDSDSGFITNFNLRIWMEYSDEQVFLPASGESRPNAGASVGFYSADGTEYFRFLWTVDPTNTAVGNDADGDGVADSWTYTLSETSVVQLDRYRARKNGALFDMQTIGFFTEMPFAFSFREIE